MPYNPTIHHRHCIRLKGYDYSQEGLYFVTICAHYRQKLFGTIIDGEMMLNDFGIIAYNEWKNLSERYPNAFFDIFQIMPNHVHGIIALNPAIIALNPIVGATLAVAQNDDVGNLNSAPIVGATLAVAQNDDVGNLNSAPIVGATLAVAQNDNVGNLNSAPIVGATLAVAQNDDVGNLNRATARVAPTTTDNTNDANAKTTITVGAIVGAYKSLVANKCLVVCKLHNSFMGKLWQRNYYEHIIRNDNSYQRIADYIINNPAKWASDIFYLE